MAHRRHPSDAIFRAVPGVSKEELTSEDSLALQKAVVKVISRIINIGQMLGLPQERIDEIVRLHRADNRRALAIIDTWLRKDFNDKATVYCTAGNTAFPSWWNLVWAVASRAGGNHPAHARKIAENWKNFQQTGAEDPKFQHISTEPLDEGEALAIRDSLEDVWINWYEIGAGLKLQTATLDRIEDQDKPLEDKMLEMIKTWIREGVFEEPCWRRLLEVVAASYGGQNPALAQNLAENHSSSNGEALSMEIEPEVDPPSSTMDETNQARQVGASMMADSFNPHPATVSSFPDLQLDTPLISIVDDGGKPRTADQFIVYSRNSHTIGGKPSHGLALIISNEKFSNLPERICAPYDDQRLKKTLTALGYRVVIRKNQTGREMRRLFEAIRENGPGDLHIRPGDDSFVCVVSSHGGCEYNMDVIYGRDRDTLFLQQTAYDNLGATACPHLKGKPKLFFIQACRGTEYGRIADDSATQVPLPTRLPRESDFLFSFSTAPYTKSYRYDPNRPAPEGEPVDLSGQEKYDKHNVGSFYITELCFALHRFGPKMELVSILLSVHHMLQAHDKNLFELGSMTVRQCPHLTTSLRGPVFFYDEAETLFKDYVKICLE